MVCAGVEVLLDPRQHRRLVTPGDDCVDEPVTASVLEVVFTKALPEQAAAKVLDPEIPGEIRATDRTSTRSDRLD